MPPLFVDGGRTCDEESPSNRESEHFEGNLPHFGQFAIDAGVKTESEQSHLVVEGVVDQRESQLDGKPHRVVYSMYFCSLQ